MPTKSTPKKKAVIKAKAKVPAKRVASQKVTKADRVYNIGKAIAKRDFILGDQINDNRQQIAQINSPQQFVDELEKLRTQIAAVKATPQLSSAEVRRIEVVEADVVEVIEEARKPEPVAKRINQTLDGASDTMGKIGKSVAAAVGLGTTLAGLGGLALKLFGG